jgi:hypothetical protein
VHFSQRICHPGFNHPPGGWIKNLEEEFKELLEEARAADDVILSYRYLAVLHIDDGVAGSVIDSFKFTVKHGLGGQGAVHEASVRGYSALPSRFSFDVLWLYVICTCLRP